MSGRIKEKTVQETIEAFEKRETYPPLQYSVFQKPLELIFIEDAPRKVNTKFGEREVIGVQVKENKYSLWLSREGLKRLVYKLLENYGSLKGLKVELEEAGKAGRAYNYKARVLEK